ncbi:hypothetical protein [Dyella jiangningensis]|uniref:Uncharacterized protein n=1 Tax=Dyella jiangningensis TaxID=1379159 RepID=A0A328PAK3_9GAMM|nr:hypothetical protein [Dyella jiangningensis]RAO77712.1 hypothetical protein CA260_07575 [Dyella jiangningensis]
MKQAKQPPSSKTAGENVQSQGGIRRDEVEEARSNFDPASGGQGGHLATQVPGQSLDEGGDELNTGFTGDDGAHVAANTVSEPGDLEPWQAANTLPDNGQGTDLNIGSRDMTDRPPTDDIGTYAAPTSTEGGQGSVSGTGNARPHHGREAENETIERSGGAGAGQGSSYQSGGTAVDRAQKIAERKAQEGTAASPRNEAGGRDPSPRTPLGKDRSR